LPDADVERPLTAKDDSSEATIRQPRQADLPDLLELFRHLSPEDPEPDPARAALAWSRLLGSDLATVFVAEHRKRLVASCTLVVLGLTRFGGHPEAFARGAPDAQNPCSVYA